ncbi:hypothetical protein GCM10027290_16380 [Micromonospora sonneratiae]
MLRELVEASPEVVVRPGRGVPEELIRQAEALIGPLSPSYRWWLAEYGSAQLGGEWLATLAPPEHRAHAHDELTTAWRRTGDRLCFHTEADGGDTYYFALDERVGAEHPVVRVGHDGDEEPYADSFAGFLTVQVALANRLRDGPNPDLARLWRLTPGVLLPNGVLIYGPHTIAERNETYEVHRYAPHWVLIGDDSGGSGLFMRRHGRDRTSVHRLDLGAIEEDIATAAGQRLTGDLLGWLGQGADMTRHQYSSGQ